jgi:hypothetical protein
VFLCSSDFDGSLEESRDDLQSLGYDTPVTRIRSDSYTTLMNATQQVPELAHVGRAVEVAGDDDGRWTGYVCEVIQVGLGVGNGGPPPTE